MTLAYRYYADENAADFLVVTHGDAVRFLSEFRSTVLRDDVYCHLRVSRQLFKCLVVRRCHLQVIQSLGV